MMAGYRHSLFVAALAATLPPAAAYAASPLAATSFELGRAPSGESCRADSSWEDPVTKARRFDRAFEVQCRGWTDTQTAGQLYALGNTPAAKAALASARGGRLNCGGAVEIDIPGIGRAEASRCTDREGNFPALAVTVVRGGSIFVAEGLERFSGNLAAGLRIIAARASAPAANSVANAAFALGKAPDPSPGGNLTGADSSRLTGRWREAVGYSVRGQNIEAREIVSRSEGRLPAAAALADRATLKLEAALSESNLGNNDSAIAQLDQAAALLATAGASTTGFLATKLRVYSAMVALNRRDYPTALANASAGLAAATALSEVGGADPSSTSNPLLTAVVLRELNAQQGGNRPELLRAGAQYVRGAAFRQTGKLRDAQAALSLAEASIRRIERSGVEPSNLQWLRSQIAVEQARALMVQGKVDPAKRSEVESHLRDSVECLERSGGYGGSPLLAQRKLGYAGFLAEYGDQQKALRQYDEAIAIMRAAGPSAVTSGEPLEAYFRLLTATSAGQGNANAAAQAKFFLASQLVNPPLVAAQITQIQKIFEASGSQGAVLAKTLQDLDREGRLLQARSAALRPDASRDRERLTAAIIANDARIAEVRGQLGKDDKYLQANDSPVTLTDLQAALKPGEAYLKIVTLPRATYVLAATRDAATVYQVAGTTAELTKLEKQVRASIDGNVSKVTGFVVPLVFDVDAAHQLHRLLIEPAQSILKGVTALIAEPTGGLNELPIGVLVADQASVDSWKVTIKSNSRDYTGVAFLAKAFNLGTSVSPRAFLVGRNQPASRAPLPYVGFGNHALATDAELATLGTRGELANRCAVRAEAVRSGYASLPPLGEKELAAAAAVAGSGSMLVEGESFTDTALTSAKPGTYAQYAVVHFATHGIKEGEMGCDNPPALITSIAPDGVSDGLLSFEKIANMQFDANLIVLSACNTAAQTRVSRAIAAGGFRSGAAGQSAAFNGLVRAFLTAGGRAVLSTHWAIPDALSTRNGPTLAPSTLLIGKLFEGGKTTTIAGALRQAQTERIGQVETSHPYYWGAFAIVGDGEKFMFARAS